MSKSHLVISQEIKHPFAHLEKGDYNTVVFFVDENDTIISWDDIPDNYPRWGIAFHTREEALTRICEMVENEDWILRETTEEELKQFVGTE